MPLPATNSFATEYYSWNSCKRAVLISTDWYDHPWLGSVSYCRRRHGSLLDVMIHLDDGGDSTRPNECPAVSRTVGGFGRDRPRERSVAYTRPGKMPVPYPRVDPPIHHTHNDNDRSTCVLLLLLLLRW